MVSRRIQVSELVMMFFGSNYNNKDYQNLDSHCSTESRREIRESQMTGTVIT